MATDAKTLLSQANCYACYTTMEWDLLALALLAQWVNNAAVVPIDPDVTAWVARAQAGGGHPSQHNINAVNTFWRTIKAAGFSSKFIHLNPIAGDDWVTARTPLIVGLGGFNQWVDVNGGLQGNQIDLAQGLNGDTTYSSQQAFDTGVIPGLTGITNGNCGVSVYVSVAEPDGTNHTHGGCDNFLDGGGQQFKFIYDYILCGFDNTLTNGAAEAVDYSPWAGFASSNATGASGWFIAAYGTFNGGSVEPYGILPQNNGFGQGPPYGGGACPVTRSFWWLDSNGQFSEPSGETLSFAAFHLGLTFAQSVILFNAVQTMRQTMGGGYV